jgi:predicted acyltransferase
MTTQPPTRVYAIDALRGFDMFWIIGGDAFFSKLMTVGGGSWGEQLSQQLEHVEWEGFRFYDLIFPLFLFLVGCVLPYSLEKYRENPQSQYVRILRRTLLLVALGLMNAGILQFHFAELRYAGVLQRIGICYGIAALVYLHVRPRGQAILLLTILFGYWGLLSFVPVPGGVAGDLTPSGNLAGYVDRLLLPGKIFPQYYGFGDNEGILSTIPAVATTILGALAGQFLRSAVTPNKKVIGLALAGATSLGIGYVWAMWFPLIKILWTSSFVLVSGGWSLLLLALFYTFTDVIGWKRWAAVFTVIGANAITIYVAQRFIDFSRMSQFFLGGFASLSPLWGTVILLGGTLTAKILFLAFLYRQRIFLRV